MEAILAALPGRVHLRAPVRRIERDRQGVELRFDDTVARFDEVVLAVHSDQALALLAAPTAAEREVLGAIPYKTNEAVLHTDERLLPRRRAARASWNYHLPRGARRAHHDHLRHEPAPVAARRPQLPRHPEPDRRRSTPTGSSSRFEYAHPVYTRAGVAAQRRWAEISGRNRTHYCGAYWRWGFHEDGCRGRRCARCAELLERAAGRGAAALAA